jgi:hypothetical protein
MLRYLLAAPAYRTQKALRDAPESFGAFEAGQQVRTPTDLSRPMENISATRVQDRESEGRRAWR